MERFERLLELVRSLLEFTARSGRVLERRGRRPWSATAALATGRCAELPVDRQTPVWVFEGPLVGELRRFFAHFSLSSLARERKNVLFLHPELLPSLGAQLRAENPAHCGGYELIEP